MNHFKKYKEKAQDLIAKYPKTSIALGLVSLKLLLPLLKRPKNLAGEVVFITGAASGIGRRMAMEFVRQGAKVIVADIQEKQAKVVAYEINSQIKKDHAFAVLCDVTSLESVKSAAEAAKTRFGPITILVNNAGIVSGKPITELSYESIERTFKVNSISHFYTIKEFLPDMLEKNHGHIVTIASIAGINGVSKMTDYCGSKFAAFGINESLRLELSSSGSAVKTTCVCPYFINTGMFKGVTSRYNFLFPILEETWMANRIIKAVKYNEEVVIEPRTIRQLTFIKGLFPVSQGDFWSRALGFQQSMNTFQGRH